MAEEKPTEVSVLMSYEDTCRFDEETGEFCVPSTKNNDDSVRHMVKLFNERMLKKKKEEAEEKERKNI